MAILLRPNKPPHWAMMAVLVTLAFIMSIVWLHILANEVVSVLSSLGLLLNIDTGDQSNGLCASKWCPLLYVLIGGLTTWSALNVGLEFACLSG